MKIDLLALLRMWAAVLNKGFGRTTGDVGTETEGKIKQATGVAQDVYGQAKDAAGEAYGNKEAV